MNEKEAIITLAYYNDWRQGKDEDAPMVKPEHVTEAIKVVIQKWKERNDEKCIKRLFTTDYVIYDKANDHVLSDSYGRVILFGDKSEADSDCRGNEIVIPCTDLPTAWQEEIKKQL
jgi:hypothetical protein